MFLTEKEAKLIIKQRLLPSWSEIWSKLKKLEPLGTEEKMIDALEFWRKTGELPPVNEMKRVPLTQVEKKQYEDEIKRYQMEIDNRRLAIKAFKDTMKRGKWDA